MSCWRSLWPDDVKWPEVPPPGHHAWTRLLLACLHLTSRWYISYYICCGSGGPSLHNGRERSCGGPSTIGVAQQPVDARGIADAVHECGSLPTKALLIALCETSELSHLNSSSAFPHWLIVLFAPNGRSIRAARYGTSVLESKLNSNGSVPKRAAVLLVAAPEIVLRLPWPSGR